MMHRDRRRLKEVATIGSGTTPKSGNEQYYEGGVHPWLNTGCVQDCMILSPAKYVTDLAMKECSGLRYYPAGTILVAMYGGGTIGNVGLMTFPSTINQACCAIVPDTKLVVPKYVFYVLHSQKELMISYGFGGTQINLSQGQIANFCIQTPSLEDQHRIVNYLDAKTSAIDSQISVLEKKRDAYERLKQSVINRAVTRGLDENVPLKPSGVDWIGMIPEHWERKRLKDISSMYGGLSGKSGDDFRCDDESLTKPFIPFTNILNNNIVDLNQVGRVVIDKDETQNKIKQNDLLFLMSSEDYESIAKSAVVLGSPEEIYLNSFCRGLRITSKEVSSAFLNYQLSASIYRDALRFEARGFTRINIKIDRIASHFITLPPLNEQQAIVDYLDSRCNEIQNAIVNVNNQIDAYKRLKRSLINEVVTGQRAV